MLLELGAGISDVDSLKIFAWNLRQCPCASKRNVMFSQKSADEITFVFDLLLSLDIMLYLPWPYVTSRHIVVETYELCQTYKQSVFSI